MTVRREMSDVNVTRVASHARRQLTRNRSARFTWILGTILQLTESPSRSVYDRHVIQPGSACVSSVEIHPSQCIFYAVGRDPRAARSAPGHPRQEARARVPQLTSGRRRMLVAPLSFLVAIADPSGTSQAHIRMYLLPFFLHTDRTFDGRREDRGLEGNRIGE
jgi:hypothetical protein